MDDRQENEMQNQVSSFRFRKNCRPGKISGNTPGRIPGVSVTADATFTKAYQDWDDGRMVYEIEFHANGTEYDMDVDVNSGRITDFSTEYHGGYSQPFYGGCNQPANGGYYGYDYDWDDRYEYDYDWDDRYDDDWFDWD